MLFVGLDLVDNYDYNYEQGKYVQHDVHFLRMENNLITRRLSQKQIETMNAHLQRADTRSIDNVKKIGKIISGELPHSRDFPCWLYILFKKLVKTWRFIFFVGLCIVLYAAAQLGLWSCDSDEVLDDEFSFLIMTSH